MKKILFIIAALFISIFGSAQVAPNFTATDCNGTSIDLYSQLDAGKVIVICWVMPCSSCIPASKTSYNVVQSFQTSNPNRVLFFLCDDYADTPCSSINSWANSNAIPASTSSLRFSNAIINMTNYGSTGMPKVTIIGGADHKILYNVNGAVDGTAMQTAINNALIASGVEELGLNTSDINLFPNPTNNVMHLNVTMEKQVLVTIELFDILGQKVFASADKLNKGINKIDISTLKLNNGIYFVKISDVNKSKTLKFTVSH